LAMSTFVAHSLHAGCSPRAGLLWQPHAFWAAWRPLYNKAMRYQLWEQRPDTVYGLYGQDLQVVMLRCGMEVQFVLQLLFGARRVSGFRDVHSLLRG
jgi:hypothetical protein